jgi:poly-gamma-glutamate synthesis protein (capsule biosynthesis protein)
MDRRAFLKTAARAAALAGAARLAESVGRAAPATPASTAPDRLTLAAVGDCLPSRRVSELKDPDFLALVDLLRGTDAVWGNCESVLADAGQVYPAPKGGDPHDLADPGAADEFRFLGLRLMGMANNHTLDYGNEGLFATLANLDRVGIAHAGAGVDLAQASRPGVFDSRAGRIADVNCASTFADYFAAGEAHPYLPGRPGLNPLHVDYSLQVDRDLFTRLKAAEARLKELDRDPDSQGSLIEHPEDPKASEIVDFGDLKFRQGDRLEWLSAARPVDVTRITGAIRTARHGARVVIASIHAHEKGRRLVDPDPFLPLFAHACIDAGADLFVAAGPHVLRPVEVYKGKPIFYSLGNFLFQGETVRADPAEDFAFVGLDSQTLDVMAYEEKIGFKKERRFWQSVVPRLTWEGERLAAIDLHPVTLGFGLPVDRRGTPRLARGEEAKQILSGLAELSQPYGTTIAIAEGVGRVKLG